MSPIDRRHFLRAGSAAALAFLAACAREETKKPTQGTIDDILGSRQPNIELVPAGTELIEDRGERVAFGIIDTTTNRPIPNGKTRLWAAPDRQTKALGPFEAPYHGDGLGDRGVYVARVNFPVKGTYLLLSETVVDGKTLLGINSVDVGVRNAMPKIGDPAIRVETPTKRNARGVDPICTLDPVCSLHEVSLMEALEDEKPIVLIFATPGFCESRLCGPEVQMVQSIAGEHGDDAVFIHAEIYRDDNEATIRQAIRAPAPVAWKIVEEPAIYYIDRAGRIVERQLGPIDRTDVRTAVEALLA